MMKFRSGLIGVSVSKSVEVSESQCEELKSIVYENEKRITERGGLAIRGRNSPKLAFFAFRLWRANRSIDRKLDY